MKTIKNRRNIRNIKYLDLSVNLSKRMKSSIVQVKERAEETRNPHDASPADYAVNKVQDTMQRTPRQTVNNLPATPRKAHKNIEHARGSFKEVRRLLPKERIRSAELAQKTADKAKTAADELQNFAVKAKESAYEAKTTVSDAKNTLREVRRAGRQTVRDVKQNIRLTKSGVQVGGPLNTTGIPDIEPSSLSSSVSGTMHGTNISFTPKSRAKLADKPLIKYKNVKTIYKSPIKVNVSSPKIPPLTNEGPLNAISKPKAYPESIKPVSTPANSIEINSMSQSGYLRKGIKPLRNTVDMPKITQTSAKSTSKAYKTAKKRIKDTAKGTVKTAKKSVKTAEQTAKAAVKTARQTTKTAQKSAQTAAKAAKASVKVSQTATKAVVYTAKASAKAIAAMVKMAIAAVRGLITAIIAGGWVAVFIILFICLIGMFAGSVYGIFFANEQKAVTGKTMSSVITEINKEFTAKIDEIIRINVHDLLDISGARAAWKDVLAVYTVRTVIDPSNPMDVATIDDQRVSILRSVFWDMNIISYTLESITDMEDKEKTKLSINVVNKAPDEMASQYGFSDTQKEQLNELLSPSYNDMWNALLYGVTSTGDSSICEVAASQIGNIGGEIYWRWYGFKSRVEWCAVFVSWCADQCGYIDAGIIPKFSSCAYGVQWFKNNGQWRDNDYTPNPGDIIFYDFNYNDSVSDHVGIVARVEGDTVYTIEGNTGVGNTEDICAERRRGLNNAAILGYGVPLYTQ